MRSLNQDPWWRCRVLPLFTFDPECPDERPIGLGTAFRVDPFGNAFTAFHVIEDLLEIKNGKLEAFPSRRLVALDMPEGAIMLGRVGIPKEWWRPLSSFLVLPVGMKPSPLFHQPDRMQNVSELALLGLEPMQENRAPYLPVRLRGPLPRVGEIVTAYGFADLDRDRYEDDAISQYLYEISGPITEIVTADAQSTRPWPKLMVEAHWPSGMSGGPVVNADGEVIGLVSTSFDGADHSTAHIFAAWDIPEKTAPMLDPSNPGWHRGFAAIDHGGSVRFFGHDVEEVENFARSNSCKCLPVSIKLETGAWVSSLGQI